MKEEQFFSDKKPWPEGVVELEPTGDLYEDQDIYCVINDKEAIYIRDGDFVVTDSQGRHEVIPEKDHK